ncbi:hypothetical protein V6Z12_A09G005500 [Gossypium hirsutum]
MEVYVSSLSIVFINFFFLFLFFINFLEYFEIFYFVMVELGIDGQAGLTTSPITTTLIASGVIFNRSNSDLTNYLDLGENGCLTRTIMIPRQGCIKIFCIIHFYLQVPIVIVKYKTLTKSSSASSDDDEKSRPFFSAFTGSSILQKSNQ